MFCKVAPKSEIAGNSERDTHPYFFTMQQAHMVSHIGEMETPTQFGPHLTSVDWILHTRPPPYNSAFA